MPTLENNGDIITQSSAIIEYLEEKMPTPPLLPEDLGQRAKIRACAAVIGCDIHPLNNLRVLKYLQGPLEQPDEVAKVQWYHHWIKEGFTALEALLSPYAESGPYAFGKKVTLADLYIVPQVYNANRFECPMNEYPRILAINEACLELDAFKAAAPA